MPYEKKNICSQRKRPSAHDRQSGWQPIRSMEAVLKVLEKGIDVVCVFYEGKVPEPRRFKIKYKNGTIKTVDIDLVKRSEVVHPGGLYNIVYRCQSEIEEQLIEYELRYMVKEMKWELYSVI